MVIDRARELFGKGIYTVTFDNKLIIKVTTLQVEIDGTVYKAQDIINTDLPGLYSQEVVDLAEALKGV